MRTRNNIKPTPLVLKKKKQPPVINKRQVEFDKKELVFNYKNKGIISGVVGKSRENDKADWFDKALAFERAQ